MFDLSGKTALVTGASGGIGGAIAKALHAQGAGVVLSGTRAEALEALRSELGARAFVAACNLASMTDVEALPKKAEEAAGASIDILVNNAGVTRDNLFLRMKDEEWDQVIAVDLTAAFRLARGAARHDEEALGPDRLGHFGRGHHRQSRPGQLCRRQGRLGGMSKSLAAEVASRNITVNCVAPGFIATAMTEVLNEAQKQAILPRIPAGRMGTPGEIAAAVVYLASEEAPM
jgi:3-oxoacyl-[acyl-carrier protein] reductase